MTDQPDADTPDVDGLARRLLDLWQDQLSALPEDPELRDSLARLLGRSAVPPGTDLAELGRVLCAAPWLVAGPGTALKPDGGPARDGSAQRQTNGRGAERSEPAAAAPGPAAAAPAFDRRDLRLEQLEARLGALEERIDRLAAGLEGGRRASARKPRAGRS